MSSDVSDFLKKLITDKSSKDDCKNFIASHIQAAFTFYENTEEEKEKEENLKKSLDNLEKNDKMEAEDLKTYYSRILKSQLLYYSYDKGFDEAGNGFLQKVFGINISGSTILQDSVKIVYLSLLADFLNSIGSEKFVTAGSVDEKSIKATLSTLKIIPSDHKKLFQRLLTKNGFIKPYSGKLSLKYQKSFDVKDRFDLDKFLNIFEILTEAECSNFEGSVNALLKSTNDTPLMFLNRFSDMKSEIFRFVTQDGILPSFVSSPPHAYEKLIIDKLAICYPISDHDENPYEEEEEEEEADDDQGKKHKSKEVKFYKQLLAANLRFRKPPEKRPEASYFERLNIEPAASYLPSDLSIRGTCNLPFYYDLGEKGEKAKDIKKEIICKDWQENLRKSLYTDICDGLHPIEAQLLRILEFSALENAQKKSFYKEIYGNMFEEAPDNKEQVDISRSLISMILFPETRVGIAQNSTDLFIMSCFSELYKLLSMSKILDASSNLQNYLTAGKVRRVFQLAMDGIIPAVSQQFVKLAQWTQERISDNDAEFEEPENDKDHSIFPFSTLIFLRQFALNPTLRRKCPVIYAFLRLQSHFCLTKRIRIISDMLNRVWESYTYKFENEEEEDKKEDEKDVNDMTFEDLDIEDEELMPFLNCWLGALDFVSYGPLSKEARERIEESREEAGKANSNEEEENNEGSLASQVKIRPFLPYEPGSWPGLIVLETLSRAHNEFISVLQQHSKILVYDVNDLDFLDSQVLDIYVIGKLFSRAIRGKIGPDCLPVFDESIEKEFIQQAALLPYHYILHPIINFAAKEEITMNSKGLVSFYEEHFNTIDLSEEQKKMLHIHVKECNKTAGALLLLSKYMYSAVSKGNEFKSTDNLSTFIERTEIAKTPLENESYSALLIAKGKLREDFKVGQFSKMYTFLSEPIDNCRKAYSLQEAIIDNVINTIVIKNVEIDNIGLPNVKDYRPYFTVIPKLLGDLLRLTKSIDNEEFKLKQPSELIDMWFNKLDEKKRSLIDKEEEAALEAIKGLDEGRNNKLATLISYFNDAKVNYKW